MDLKLRMRVHTAVVTQTRVSAERKGQPISALIDVLEVELEAVEEGHGSMTLRYSEDIVENIKKFMPGRVITYTPSFS